MKKFLFAVFAIALFTTPSYALLDFEMDSNYFSQLKERFESANDPISLEDITAREGFNFASYVATDEENLEVYSDHTAYFFEKKIYKTIVHPEIPSKGPLFPGTPERKDRTLAAHDLTRLTVLKSRQIDDKTYNEAKDQFLNIDLVGKEIEKACLDLDKTSDQIFIEQNTTEVFNSLSAVGIENTKLSQAEKDRCKADGQHDFEEYYYFRKSGDHIFIKLVKPNEDKSALIEKYSYMWK
jgi:hypothetical protein